MHKMANLLGTSILALAISCIAVASVTRDTTDWMPEGSFTSGVEGPVVGPDGSLYAVNFARQGTIGRVTAKDSGEVWLQLPEGSIGNSLRFHDGFLYVADYTGHNVLKIDPASKKVIHKFHNPQMHQPNDIAISASGTIYASDPDWANNSGQLWRISPEGTFALMEKDMGTTNGIELSPDGKNLYLNESVQRRVWVYDVLDNGDLANKQLLMAFDDFGMDGMQTDAEGNLYITRYGAGVVLKVSPAGEVLSTIQLSGQHPTNIALSTDSGTGYVTMQQRGAIEQFSVER
ncbi:SMP-30/gluconolactonase/LRE family protein [Microbulbifer sp. CAU 1566]|uniref:SMP-30/gluconolactonase/LRE family protein n=1 Tax=Microbulbifer sp. CAU 1566 TaxID=2933269 RepID=UPI0020030E6A|nr:SMP-30/gluconolactonase/LRE family protein [Microbulbifer sp. CAU 1566]MCK7596230.1 SMP-30/gluconolactonase/LRE family protein [Microbulbifer sp. CAU 1566]